MDKDRSKEKVDIRAMALDILLQLRSTESKSHVILKNTLDKYDYLPPMDKNFLKRLVDGTIEYRMKEDYIIACFSKTPINKLKPVIHEILRMSIYQYLYMDRVPDNAVCNEAVRLTQARGLGGLKGFVNGVLRSVMRGYSDIKWPDKNDDLLKYLSVEYSCPEYVVQCLLSDYGPEKTEDMLKASLDQRAVYARIDESLSADDMLLVMKELKDNGCISETDSSNDTSDTEYDYAVRISNPDIMTRMSGFREGRYTIQDISSMSVCEMAFTEIVRDGMKDISGDMLVYDICAAPGGKTMHAVSKLRRYGIKGRVISADVSGQKLAIIKENIRRMRCEDMTELKLWDATVIDEDMIDKADLVIADVPCSGLGVIGRKPDIKYNVTKENFEDIVDLQRRIIDNAVRYVKPGGVLVYSTCTVRRAENDGNVDHILSKGGYELKKATQLFITEDHDGFYTAVLRRLS